MITDLQLMSRGTAINYRNSVLLRKLNDYNALNRSHDEDTSRPASTLCIYPLPREAFDSDLR